MQSKTQTNIPIKKKLASALDDNLHTRVWHNYVDWLIIFMILLSTAEIFLSTLDLSKEVRDILLIVDITTLVFFTVEVSLRIWVAPEIDPKFKGFKGRLKYCTSFYGFIDVVSTFPFYLQWLFPLPVMALKGLRMVRVMRVFRLSRYAKSFGLLSDAIKEKRHELIVSLQFLVIVTIVLSLLLYFFEHEVQPDVYNNGFVSAIWAFAQYIGNPGAFADTPPLSTPGRIIACLVGLLGIAIVAVPAGIIGSGFTEAIENDKKKKEVAENIEKLHNAFERKLDRPTGIQIVPPFRSFQELTSRANLTTDQIIEAANESDEFRIINLASTIPQDQIAQDRLAIEHFPRNTPYGCCIDRGSNLTIISQSSMIDACTGSFAFYVALFGGFNYISREVGAKAPYKSYFLYSEDTHAGDSNFEEYQADLRRLLSCENPWGISLHVASGAAEPVFDTHLHMEIGGPKGDNRRSGNDLFISDEKTYNAVYADLEKTLGESFGMLLDHQKYHSTASPNNFMRRMDLIGKINLIVMRFEWAKILWNSRRIELAKTVAECLAREITHKPCPSDFPGKDIGFNGYLDVNGMS